MEELTFRIFQPSDREKIYKLWVVQFKPDHIEKRKNIFPWLVEGNPYSMGKCSPYHIVECNNEVVGYYGKMPLKFMVKGKIIDAFFSHDLLLHLRYWGKGVADKLVMELAAGSDSLIAAIGMGQSNYKLHKRCGWLDINGCYLYLNIYNIEWYLKKKLKNELIAKVLSYLLNGTLKMYRLSSMLHPVKTFQKEVSQSFDARFDAFAERVSKHFGVIVLRSAMYLTWKYLQKPNLRYWIVSALQEGQIVGYVVFRLKRANQTKVGIIVDILADPRQIEVFRFLLLEAVKYLRGEKVDYITCLVTYPAFLKVMRECGFIRAPHCEAFMSMNWEKCFSKEYAEKIENWYLTLGDSDCDAWEINES